MYRVYQQAAGPAKPASVPNIIATINVTANLLKLPVRRGRRAVRFFYLQVDSCANVSIVCSAESLVDVKTASANEVIMMNSYPAPVAAYGTLKCDVMCEKTKRWTRLCVNNVAVVPSSSFNLLGWSAYQASTPRLPTGSALTFTGTHVILPLAPSGTAMGSLRGGLFSFRCRLANVHRAQHALAHVKEEEIDEDETKDEEKDDSEMAGAENEDSEEAAVKAAMIEKGAVIMAKARALMRKWHLKFSCMAKVGAIQTMLRRGDLNVNNAAVRDEMLRMEASELECDACALAATNQKHPSAQNSVAQKGQWTMDGSGKYWRSRRGNKWAVVMVAPEGKGVFVAFMKHKAEMLQMLQMNRRIWQQAVKEKILRLRMDRAAEQTSGTMARYLAKHGITPSFTAPNSSAGPAEAYIHLFQDGMMANLNTYATLHNTQRPHHLWEYAFRYARDVKDLTPC
jgi:hypothetical protein